MSRLSAIFLLLLLLSCATAAAQDNVVISQGRPDEVELTAEEVADLLVDYAVCCFRLGDVDKGINTLEQQFRKGENGLLYQTLGYLYVEKYDAANRPDTPKSS